MCRYRLGVRTDGSQPSNRGSIPRSGITSLNMGGNSTRPLVYIVNPSNIDPIHWRMPTCMTPLNTPTV